MREHLGVIMPPVAEFWTHWNAQEQFGTKADHEWMWSEGVKRGLFRYGHAITGARIGLEQLVANGHELIIVTHRPANAITDTLDWVSLQFKDIPLAGFHIMSNGEAKEQVDADVLIDDKAENVLGWALTGRKAILFNAPYNQHTEITNVIRCNGWKEVVYALS